MPNLASPCCPGADTVHLADLDHVRQFDLDLHRCMQCSRHWVRAWRAGTGGWEPASDAEAASMLALEGPELRAYLREWALSFS